MNCELLLSGALNGAAASGSATRFAELLRTCAPATPGDQYVAPPSSAEVTAANPFFDVMSRIDQLELPSRDTTATEGSTDAATEFGNVADAALQTQKEILRTVIMMETMNSAKQGVTTLFQLQG